MKVKSILFALLVLSGAGILFALQARRAAGPAGSAYVISSSDDTATDSLVSRSEGTSRHTRKRPKSGADSEQWLSGFELIERSGETVRSQDLKGQPYVVGFFFTLCPSICLNQNAKVQELQE